MLTYRSQDTVQKLRAYSNATQSITSIYLDIPQTTRVDGNWLQDTFHLLLDTKLRKEQKVLYTDHIRFIDAYLKRCIQKMHISGLAVFMGDDTFMEIVPLMYHVPSLLIVDHTPYIQPLIVEQSRSVAEIVSSDTHKVRPFSPLSANQSILSSL